MAVADDRPIVGFISPPRWYDPSPAEFATICAGVRTQQVVLPMHRFVFDLPNIAGAIPEVAVAARTLGEVGCRVICTTGTPYAWAGLPDEAAMRARAAMLADASGAAVVMAGSAIIDGLRALGARRVAIASPYYAAHWREHFTAIVRSCGIEVLLCQSLDQQGLVPEDPDMVETHGWRDLTALTITAVEKIAADAAEADAVVIAGASARNLDICVDLEARIGRPLVASDTALYWAIARELGLPLAAGVLGRLTAAG